VAPLARPLVCFIFALALGVPAVAHAEGPTQLSVATAGSCPSAAEVAEALRELMPDAALAPSPDVVDSDVIVSDRGAGFTVKVRGQRRRFRDVERDCTERARHVAVFTVLIVDPLRVPNHVVNDAEEEPESAEKSAKAEILAPARPKSAAASPAEPRFDLSLGPLAQVALKANAEVATQAGGLGLRLRYGQRIGITLGVAGLLPASLHFATADARATWMPLDFGVSLSRRFASWEVEMDLGMAGALLLVEGQGQALDQTQQAFRLEVGGRLGAQLRYWASERAGVCGGMFGSWFPNPYSLRVEGMGVVGNTPSAWIGGSLGAVITL
jgi:hypothetical protein